MKKILLISGSPKKDGNTDTLIKWFSEGARSKGAETTVVHAAFLKYKTAGCTSCRICQNIEDYECAIDDDVRTVLENMTTADVIVMATPLYFFSASSYIKVIIDRMFSLYKWDNESDTFTTPLKGKTFVLIASAYEDMGLDALEKPFALTAEYTGMKFYSLLVPNAGVSGKLKDRVDVRQKAVELGKKMAI